MFFGIGAYGVAIATRMGPTWEALAVGVAVGWVSLVLSLAVGLFSLRVRAIFFAMITLAVASAFHDAGLAAVRHHRRRRRPELQGCPPSCCPATSSAKTLSGRDAGRSPAAHLLPAVGGGGPDAGAAAHRQLALGRVPQAIRENEFRAGAIGYRVVVYRTTSSVLSALFACVAGAMLALWLRYNGPTPRSASEIMMDVLLIVVIGGMGTIYGAAIGAALFLVAQSYLQDLLRLGSETHGGHSLLRRCCRPTAGCRGTGVLFAVGLLLPHRRGGPSAGSGAAPELDPRHRASKVSVVLSNDQETKPMETMAILIPPQPLTGAGGCPDHPAGLAVGRPLNSKPGYLGTISKSLPTAAR